MKTSSELLEQLKRLDGRGYKAYKDIKGEYQYDKFRLIVDHVQGDPFADPSRLRARIPHDVAQIPRDAWSSKSREVGLRDFLAREFCAASRKIAKGARGSGKGGRIEMPRPGQEILERSSVLVSDSFIELRFRVGLPAFGRRIAGKDAVEMFRDELPKIVDESISWENLPRDEAWRHIYTNEDADLLRQRLSERGFVAFIADGALLPRASGIDPRPLSADEVVRFEAPDDLRESFTLPNAGEITGMGVSEGITLIVGGGYHGKSTMLESIENGVYNHIPGDGREQVVAVESAVKIRAEDGRRVERVNISPFIDNLPLNRDTKAFRSEDASGSTSQAANIIEALEVGASVLLMDEDTSATNFMIRDGRMQKLIAKSREPITPFIDRVRQLYDELGVSTVLVIGGAGDYFDVADTVIGMDEYRPQVMTDQAKKIAAAHRDDRLVEARGSFGSVVARAPLAESIDPSRGRRESNITARGRDRIDFGRFEIDLRGVSQIVDTAQTRAIGDAIAAARAYMGEGVAVRDLAEEILKRISTDGFDHLTGYPDGEWAAFRTLEFAAAINRLRSLEVNQLE